MEDGTLRFEFVRCGKSACKRCEAAGHGPYWYLYWREGGKVRKQYIGRNLPAEYDHLLGDQHPPLCYFKGAPLCAACLANRGYMGENIDENLKHGGITRVYNTAANRAEYADDHCYLCRSAIVPGSRRRYQR